MVIPLNIYFKIPAEKLKEFGVLNAHLGIDNLLGIPLKPINIPF